MQNIENKILKQTFIRLRDEDFIIICYIDINQFSFSEEDIKQLMAKLSKKFPNNMVIVLPNNYVDLTFTERKDAINLLRNLIEQLERENSKNEEK